MTLTKTALVFTAIFVSFAAQAEPEVIKDDKYEYAVIDTVNGTEQMTVGYKQSTARGFTLLKTGVFAKTADEADTVCSQYQGFTLFRSYTQRGEFWSPDRAEVTLGDLRHFNEFSPDGSVTAFLSDMIVKADDSRDNLVSTWVLDENKPVVHLQFYETDLHGFRMQMDKIKGYIDTYETTDWALGPVNAVIGGMNNLLRMVGTICQSGTVGSGIETDIAMNCGRTGKAVMCVDPTTKVTSFWPESISEQIKGAKKQGATKVQCGDDITVLSKTEIDAAYAKARNDLVDRNERHLAQEFVGRTMLYKAYKQFSEKGAAVYCQKVD